MSNFIEIPATNRSIAIRRPVFGIGINDADYMVGPIINGSKVWCPYYKSWKHMLERCYDKNLLEKYHTYEGCMVAKDWLKFSSFKKWMKKQDWRGKHLDKDILVVGNKLYSPDTCVFVDGPVNTLLTNSAATRGEYIQGVSFHKRVGRFQSRCSVNGKTVNIGYFNTELEAAAKYVEFKVAIIKDIANTQSPIVKKGLLLHAEAIESNLLYNIKKQTNGAI